MVIVIDVVMRHTINMPLRGAYDLVSILLLIMIFSGISHVILMNSEILIDIIDNFLSDYAVRILKLITAGATFAVTIYMLFAMYEPATSAYRYGDQSLELGLPVWMLWVFAYIGMVSATFAAAVRFVKEWQQSPDKSENTYE